MKKFYALAVTFALILTACPTDGGNGGGSGNTTNGGNGNTGGNSTTTTTLRIKNESSKVIRNVIWNNVVFNDSNTPINSGNSVVKTLEEGTGYIFFDFYSVSYRTSSVIVVEKDENAEFTFTNNTVIIEVNNANNSITIGNLPIPPTNLTVTNSTAYDFSTVEYGNIDFGPINQGDSATKEVSPGTRSMAVRVYFGEYIMAYMTVAEAISCEEGMTKQFTVTNNTIVNSARNNERGTFEDIINSILDEQKHGENGEKK